ncbi:EfeM/EfeO family lipoprotein [Candidatus Liberibacter americanus]|uniref:Periplasmic lipoprotein n=1 Tax=Candidatus Liberibacter americanus str. Sao Paulo TaxID=1261131 RepID=U6B7M5_9HYPH|nr:EfeM/EfeO family lipoprotein [Candidatus Liberibacter americanus]AHA27866.1 periplasmic lipoprotein [Candidatus Liberibacter americanus str. Sao Paulo]EMS35909.1 hypothetical protein G653_04276 [Candidatus Liberibacter americanus PW_SP]
MHNLIIRMLKPVFVVMLFSVIALFACFSGFFAPLQYKNKIIIAKGDIPTPSKYHGAIKSYLEFVVLKSSEIIFQLEIVKKELKASDLEKAQQAFIKAHQLYESIQAIVNLFGNVGRIINSQEDYFIDGVKDHRFKGFYLLEYQLFNIKDIEASLDSTNYLLIQAYDLKERISISNLNILDLLRASSDFIEIILETKLLKQDNIHSFNNLNYIDSNLNGSKAIITHLSSFIPKKTLFEILDNYRSIEDVLFHYKLINSRYVSYNKFKDKDKMLIYSLFSRQAELLATLRSLLDVDVYYKYLEENQ